MIEIDTVGLRAEAQALRGHVQQLRDQRDALTTAAEQTEARFHELAPSAFAGGNMTSDGEEATRVHALMVDYRTRLGRVIDEMKDAEKQLARLDRMLTADPAKWAAAVRDARSEVTAAEKRITANTEGSDRLRRLLAEEREGAARAREQMAARAVADLPEDVRQAIGADTAQPTGEVGDPSAHQARAEALELALSKSEKAAEQLQAELAAARAKEQAATEELLRQRAYGAEMRHAAALAAYAPMLCEYATAHEAAFGFAPELPDFRQIARESRGAAMDAARTVALAGVDDSALRRGIRRLTGL